MTHTLSSHEFGHNVSHAKHLAKGGPVFITDRGEPAFVLLNITNYRQLSGEREMSLLEAMDALPNSAEAPDFEIKPLDLELRSEV